MEIIRDTCKQNVFDLCWNWTHCGCGTNSSSRCIWKQEDLDVCAWGSASVPMTRNHQREVAMGHKGLGIYRAQIQNLHLRWTPVVMDSNCPAITAPCSGMPYISYNWQSYIPVNDMTTVKQRRINKPDLKGILERHRDSRSSWFSPAGAEWNAWVNWLCLCFEVKTTSQGSATLRDNKTSSVLW